MNSLMTISIEQGPHICSISNGSIYNINKILDFPDCQLKEHFHLEHLSSQDCQTLGLDPITITVLDLYWIN